MPEHLAVHETLRVGDEIHCVACGAWHPTALEPPTFLAASSGEMDRWLWFTCPRNGGHYYGGVVGRPPQVLARWRRATPTGVESA